MKPMVLSFSSVHHGVILVAFETFLWGGQSVVGKRHLSGFTPSSEFYFTIHEYRLPRTLLAVLVGGMMALSGAISTRCDSKPVGLPRYFWVLGHGAGSGGG